MCIKLSLGLDIVPRQVYRNISKCINQMLSITFQSDNGLMFLIELI